jgi:hypothetical protein
MDGESTAAALGAESAMLLGKLVEEKATQQAPQVLGVHFSFEARFVGLPPETLERALDGVHSVELGTDLLIQVALGHGQHPRRHQPPQLLDRRLVPLDHAIIERSG